MIVLKDGSVGGWVISGKQPEQYLTGETHLQWTGLATHDDKIPIGGIVFSLFWMDDSRNG